MKKCILILAVLINLGLNAKAQQKNTGVTINGVTWATRNVGAPGTFVENETDPGLCFQWNSKIGWYPDTTKLGQPGNSTPEGKVWNNDWKGNGAVNWQSENNPCPKGWRVPTNEEFESLFEICHPALGGKNGGVSSENHDELLGYEFINYLGQRLYFPKNFSIEPWKSILDLAVPSHWYWSADAAGNEDAWAFSFWKTPYLSHTKRSGKIMGSNRVGGYSIRCVKDEKISKEKSTDKIPVFMNGDTLNAVLPVPGSLSSLIKYKNEVNQLKIIGKCSSGDIKFIKEMATNGRLTVLDLSEAGYSDLDFSSTNLQSVIIPKNLTEIPNGAFMNCIDLLSVTIPSSVTSIGFRAFYGCCDLESIYAENIERIGDQAFYACTSLSHLYLGSGQQKIANGGFNGWYTDSNTERGIRIDGEVFKNCRSLKSVYIEDRVSVGKAAFANCDSLALVCLPAVWEIMPGAFTNCANLKEVYFGRLLKEIGIGAFNNCQSLKKVGILSGEMPKTVSVYGDNGKDYNSMESLNIFENTPIDKKLIIMKGRYYDWMHINGGFKSISEAKYYFIRAVNGRIVDVHWALDGDGTLYN